MQFYYLSQTKRSVVCLRFALKRPGEDMIFIKRLYLFIYLLPQLLPLKSENIQKFKKRQDKRNNLTLKIVFSQFYKNFSIFRFWLSHTQPSTTTENQLFRLSQSMISCNNRLYRLSEPTTDFFGCHVDSIPLLVFGSRLWLSVLTTDRVGCCN